MHKNWKRRLTPLSFLITSCCEISIAFLNLGILSSRISVFLSNSSASLCLRRASSQARLMMLIVGGRGSPKEKIGLTKGGGRRRAWENLILRNWTYAVQVCLPPTHHPVVMYGSSLFYIGTLCRGIFISTWTFVLTLDFSYPGISIWSFLLCSNSWNFAICNSSYNYYLLECAFSTEFSNTFSCSQYIWYSVEHFQEFDT